jgi:hypothetical protein
VKARKKAEILEIKLRQRQKSQEGKKKAKKAKAAKKLKAKQDKEAKKNGEEVEGGGGCGGFLCFGKNAHAAKRKTLMKQHKALDKERTLLHSKRDNVVRTLIRRLSSIERKVDEHVLVKIEMFAANEKLLQLAVKCKLIHCLSGYRYAVFTSCLRRFQIRNSACTHAPTCSASRRYQQDA